MPCCREQVQVQWIGSVCIIMLNNWTLRTQVRTKKSISYGNFFKVPQKTSQNYSQFPYPQPWAVRHWRHRGCRWCCDLVAGEMHIWLVCSLGRGVFFIKNDDIDLSDTVIFLEWIKNRTEPEDNAQTIARLTSYALGLKLTSWFAAVRRL